MALNEILRDADHLSLPVPASTESGEPVRVGGLNGVTQTAEGEGGNAENHATVWLKGAHKLNVTTSTTLSVGDPVYITSSNVLTTTDGGGSNDLFGHALEAKGNSAQDIVVRIAN